jgi:hypothetical protein
LEKDRSFAGAQDDNYWLGSQTVILSEAKNLDFRKI